MKTGLEAWIDLNKPPENFFGTRRRYEMKVKDFCIVGDPWVSDYRNRGLFERLFQLPWRPLQKTEFCPRAYWVNTDDPYVIVSIQTFLKIEGNPSSQVDSKP